MGKKKTKAHSKSKTSAKNSSKDGSKFASEDAWYDVINNMSGSLCFQNVCRQLIDSNKFEDVLRCCSQTLCRMDEKKPLVGAQSRIGHVVANLCKLYKFEEMNQRVKNYYSLSLGSSDALLECTLYNDIAENVKVFFDPTQFLPSYLSLINRDRIPKRIEDVLLSQVVNLDIAFDLNSFETVLAEVDTHYHSARKAFNLKSRFLIGSWACLLHLIFYRGDEPACSHARDALMVISTPEVQTLDISALDRRAKDSRAHALVLGMLFDNIIGFRTLNSDMNVDGFSKVGRGVHVNGLDNATGGSISTATCKRRCIELYEAAANNHDSIACLLLGRKYSVGDCVSLNSQRAEELFIESSHANNCLAMHALGVLCNVENVGIGYDKLMLAEFGRVDGVELDRSNMPDGKHKLAEINEHFDSEKKNTEMIAALYASAAASGFTPSLIALGRKLLVGDSIEKNTDAGMRLLYLAAHSGDCDAQMIVGMLHATPSYNCYNLPIAEYWLRCSVLGGKANAEVLLVRVCYQMKSLNVLSLPSPLPDLTKSAHAAKLRGDDYFRLGFYGSAIQEYSKAAHLSPQNCYLIDRMEALYMHQDDVICIQECLLFLLQSEANSIETEANAYGKQSDVDRVMKLLALSVSANAERCHYYSNSVIMELMHALKHGLRKGIATFCGVPVEDLRLGTGSSKLQERFVRELLLLLTHVDAHVVGCAMCALNSMSIMGVKICHIVIDQGGVPLIVHAMGKSDSGRSLFDPNKKEVSSSEYVADMYKAVLDAAKKSNVLGRTQQGRFCENFPSTYEFIRAHQPSLPYCDFMWIHALSCLNNIVRCCQPKILEILSAADAYQMLIQCCKVRMHVSSLISICTLTSIAIQADKNAWRELIGRGVAEAYVDSILIGLCDLDEMEEQYGIQVENGVAIRDTMRCDTESGGIDKEYETAFAIWDGQQEHIRKCLNAFEEVFMVCPIEFMQLMGTSPLPLVLEKRFRSDMIPVYMLNTVACLLFCMQLALDPSGCAVFKCISPGDVRNMCEEVPASDSLDVFFCQTSHVLVTTLLHEKFFTPEILYAIQNCELLQLSFPEDVDIVKITNEYALELHRSDGTHGGPNILEFLKEL